MKANIDLAAAYLAELLLEFHGHCRKATDEEEARKLIARHLRKEYLQPRNLMALEDLAESLEEVGAVVRAVLEEERDHRDDMKREAQTSNQ